MHQDSIRGSGLISGVIYKKMAAGVNRRPPCWAVSAAVQLLARLPPHGVGCRDGDFRSTLAALECPFNDDPRLGVGVHFNSRCPPLGLRGALFRSR
jgi:hypothetical protein